MLAAAVPGADPYRARPKRVTTGRARNAVMDLPIDQVVRQERFIREHPEWSIYPQDGATRFTAEKGDTGDCHVVAALSLRELLNRLEEIVATP